MLMGVFVLILVIVGLGAIAGIVTRLMSWYSNIWQKRFQEPRTKDILACCPHCGGSFGKWSNIMTSKIPNNPTYPSLYGTYDQLTQSRSCQDCGYGDRRVL